MKCPICGGRKFSVIARVLVDRVYDEEDKIITSDVREYLSDESDSHFCSSCQVELEDEGKEI